MFDVAAITASVKNLKMRATPRFGEAAKKNGGATIIIK
jgi:hypothetical protein